MVDVFDLRKYMTFNTEAVKSEWQEDIGKWRVKLRQTNSNGETKEFEEECDLLVYATGILNNFQWPNIPGIEKFKGRLVHTARWPEDYQKDEWAKDRVAVIGSGASSIQTVPVMQPHVKHMDIFVRTGIWFVHFANNYGHNKEYSQEERDNFRNNPKELVAHAKDFEAQINGLWGMFYSGSEIQQGAAELFRSRVREIIKDDRLFEGFNPKFELGCKLTVLQMHKIGRMLIVMRSSCYSRRSIHGSYSKRGIMHLLTGSIYELRLTLVRILMFISQLSNLLLKTVSLAKMARNKRQIQSFVQLASMSATGLASP